ncbi:MAG: 4Fe-4S binding protein [Phycisphaerae bacterium]|nr:4Fe-4S binding protein [Phycisphaerae bacterium]
MPRFLRLPRSANIFLPCLKASDRLGWRGTRDHLLARLGPTWRNSPLRRVLQAACLVLFLYAFFYVCWPYSQPFSATTLSDKQWFPAETFLLLDPLVGISTALAGRVLNWPTLGWTVGVVLLCLLVPRAFCGYLCPLGTLIDLFDWLVGRRIRRFHLSPEGREGRWWIHIRYYLLVSVLGASLGGVLLSGFVAAIPVLTRGLLFTGGRLQLSLMKGQKHLLPANWALYASIVLFAGTFLVSLLGPRFWCRCLCPSGAILSLLSPFRVGQRRVQDTCFGCGKCAQVCRFDAVNQDFTTRTSHCTFCQTCGGVCPTGSIKFVTRWNKEAPKPAGEIFRPPSPLSRRGFLAASILGTVTAAPGLVTSRQGSDRPRPIRPPGSVPEDEFLALCIRCGECFKVCPGPVLHPAGTDYGLDALWTPVAHLHHAGCHQDCNFCTQVCPTGAIQPLELAVKRRTRMGLARIDPDTCLPYRGDKLRQDCDLCYVECRRAGYDAIEMKETRIELNPPPPEGVFSEVELEAMSRIRVPVVKVEACVGCGICEYRCHTRHVVQKPTLRRSAIMVWAENEHRLLSFPADPRDLPSVTRPASVA